MLELFLPLPGQLSATLAAKITLQSCFLIAWNYRKIFIFMPYASKPPPLQGNWQAGKRPGLRHAAGNRLGKTRCPPACKCYALRVCPQATTATT
jgi:hypothetical protein